VAHAAVALSDKPPGPQGRRSGSPARHVRAVASGGVAGFCGSSTIVLQKKYPHGAGPPAGVARDVDGADQRVHVAILAVADLQQRLPQFGLEPHAGPPAAGYDVAIDKPTG